jgi:hypothetical protein
VSNVIRFPFRGEQSDLEKSLRHTECLQILADFWNKKANGMKITPYTLQRFQAMLDEMNAGREIGVATHTQ